MFGHKHQTFLFKFILANSYRFVSNGKYYDIIDNPNT